MAYDEKYGAQAVAYQDVGRSFEEFAKFSAYAVPRIIGGKLLKKTLDFTLQNLAKNYREKLSRKRKIDSEQLLVVLKEKPDAYLRELVEIFHCSTTAIFKQ